MGSLPVLSMLGSSVRNESRKGVEMFSKQHRFARVAGVVAAAAILVPVARATGDYGVPRAMPSDYATQLGQLPRAMPSDYAPAVESGDYGIPQATPADYAAHLGQLPRAMPADYGTQIGPGQYGMPRALPADFEPVGGTSGASGFDWADAGIGAGAAFGLVLLAAAATLALRGGRRLEQA
jgi:hypothetical protein